jgi:hypothetical protein
MNGRKLLELALLHKEYNCAAYLMIGFAAEYLEGEMESSKDVFNSYVVKLPDEVLRLMIADNTFDCITKLCVTLLRHSHK